MVTEAAVEVGPALFFSLLIITLSFIPVFTLEAQEGRLFAPLAFTKTYAMAASAALAVTLVPVLMGYLIRGRIPNEQSNPVNRVLIAWYRPVLALVLRFPRITIAASLLALASAAIPLSQLGGEFMPPMDEGDLLYMPSALPGLSAAKAAELLQQTDRMIRTVPEVARVFGKGRPGRNRHRPRATGDVRDHDPVQATRAVARRDDVRQAGGGPGSGRQGAGFVQHLGPADPQPHRYAGHRHQEPVGIKVSGEDLGGDRQESPARSRRLSRAFLESRRPWRSAWSVGATSMCPSTGSPQDATA